MRAVVIPEPGGPEVLQVREVPDPEPGWEQVRVRVHAAGLNRADTSQRKGRYPAPPGSPAQIPGLEFAGEVERLGPGVRSLAVGQRVYGICGGGGHAELLVTHERMCAPVPDALSWEQAGAVPETFFTVYDALFEQARLSIGEQVLVHAVGSGIGTTTVQLARAAGARTLGTSRTAEKLDRARAIGLDLGIQGPDFAEAVLQATEGQGVDVVVDPVGGSYVASDLRALAPRGRVVLLSSLGGGEATIPLGAVTRKWATIRGSVLRARPLEEKIALTRAFIHHVNPLLARGVVAPVIDRAFPLDRVADAHRALEGNQTFGKLVLTMG